MQIGGLVLTRLGWDVSWQPNFLSITHGEGAMRRALGLLGVFIILFLGGKMPVEAQPAKVVPKGKITLAWHTNMASKWLDPQEHDGTATTDNFLNALHDALIKNSRET